MKVTIIPILTSAFGTVMKGLLKGQNDFADETMQMTALLRTVRILKRILEI